MDQLVGASAAVPATPVEAGASPFISQMPTSPALLRHRMSDLWSRLKLPGSTRDQLVGACAAAATRPVLLVFVPFISQAPTSPPSWRQRMSDLRSPLKSPVAAICQSFGAAIGT